MIQYKKGRRILCILGILALALGALAGCGAKDAGAITSLEQLGEPGMKIGVGSDLIEWEMLQGDYPEAEIIAYSDNPLAYEDVAKGRIDAYIYARREMEFAMTGGTKGVRLLDEDYSKNTIVVGLSPVSQIPALEEKMNAFIAEKKADGTLDDMYERWSVRGDDTLPDIALPENPALHLCVGTTGTVMPYSYFSGTELNGYDIELAYRFAAWLGADLEFKVYDFGAIITAAVTGDVDCVMSNLYYTPEKAEVIPFSDPLFEVEITAMVRDTGALPETSDGGAQDGFSGSAKTLADMWNARIGVATGTLFPDIVHAALPEAELLYLNTTADMVNALKSGKIDAFAVDEPAARNIQAEDSSLTEFPELLDSASYAFVLTKSERGEALRAELDEYMRALWDDGTMEALQAKWFDSADLTAVESTDYRGLPATNGTIRLVTQQYPPFIHSVEGVYSGYEIEILAMFCADCGYALEIDEANFDGILASVQSGKADIGCSSITITEERKEVMLFSEPDYTGGSALIVMKDAPTAEDGTSFFASLSDSFQKTFLRENRWQLFLSGIGTTLLITVLSVIFGTALGFGVFMLCRNGNPVANTITRFCVWLVQGMPVVVLLMILYYIIFGKVAISGTAVSVVGFTLVFGAAVYAMLKSGVGVIGRGQTEAAYALGYTDHKAFYRVVLPQALPHFMPAYKGEITALIKATAVVGYVAVQDLTKMGDIVRSRTYEAFFPLIAVAVIYFILAAILTFIVNKIEIRIDPTRRTKEDILKGVNCK